MPDIDKNKEMGIKKDGLNEMENLDRIFYAQRAAFQKNPLPTAEERILLLRRLKKSILQYRLRIADAIDEDFGGRSKDESFMAEIMGSIEAIDFSCRKLKKWMKPSKRRPGAKFLPSSAKVYYQPLGVVGIIVPWNYPFFLMLSPLIGALSAGNRVIVKMSRHTPNTAELLKIIIRETYEEDHVSIFSGLDISGPEFAKKPWDHLLFTGSTSAGKDVMRTASGNLTPVTLELGGKSPVIIGQEVSIIEAAKKIAYGKTFNAGQTCVAPDYALCPKGSIDQFVEAFRESVCKMYPSLRNNPDYTNIENDQQSKHVQRLLADAKEQNAQIIEINPAQEDLSNSRKIPVYILLNVTENMEVMKKEIFGPILPVVPYDTFKDAVAYINNNPRPLALYYLGCKRKNIEYIISNTHSGGVLVNDTLIHVAIHDLPFGGIGPSGMGQYHGREGFLTFSKAKGVFFKPQFNSAQMAYPPYGRTIHKIFYKLFF